MPKWGYSIISEMLNPEKTAKASGRELKISHKAAREVCHAIKGLDLNNAKAYLRDVQIKKRAIPYMRYNKKLPHRHGLTNAFSGRYPVKAAEQILNVLDICPVKCRKPRVWMLTVYASFMQQPIRA